MNSTGQESPRQEERLANAKEFGIDPLDSDGDYLPPWKAFPEIPRVSMGWRMGSSEEYLEHWSNWYAALNSPQRAKYRGKYWPPLTWWDTYLVRSRHRTLAVIAILLDVILFVLIWPILFPLALIRHLWKSARSSEG